jgi:hypothetical protein
MISDHANLWRINPSNRAEVNSIIVKYPFQLWPLSQERCGSEAEVANKPYN